MAINTETQRPENFTEEEVGTSDLPFSRGHALLVSATIVLTQFTQMLPLGAGVNGSLNIGHQLGVDQYKSVWITSSYPLTQGAFVLIGGRIGAIFGHKKTLMVAGAIYVVFNLASGFAKSLVTLGVLRALTGIGGAFIVPNSLALLTINFPPGRWRNFTVSMFGAMTPVGTCIGGTLSGIFVELTEWKWLFFFLAMFGAVEFLMVLLVVPSEGSPFDPQGKFDFMGAFLGTGGLLVFNVVWNQAPDVGWEQPSVYVLLIVAIAMLVGFVVWEAKVAAEPILPFGIWKAPSFLPMIVATIFTFMSVIISCWYITVWNLTIRHYSLLENSAAFVPLAVGGGLTAILSGQAIRVMPAQYIMAIGSLATGVPLVILSTQPAQQTYWAQTFPALFITAMGPDFIFSAAQIIASNAVKRRNQGTAGSLIGTVASYGLSTGLGIAGTVETYTSNGRRDVIGGIRNAMYLGIGFSVAAILIALLFVRIPKDQREGWDEDDRPENYRQRILEKDSGRTA